MTRATATAHGLARALIKRIQALGNFAEFNDHRAADGFAPEAVEVIAAFLHAECGIAYDERVSRRATEWRPYVQASWTGRQFRCACGAVKPPGVTPIGWWRRYDPKKLRGTTEYRCPSCQAAASLAPAVAHA